MNKLMVRTSSKKRDNKGFSLVELIIVIAIMAVLVAVLAPQLLKYVERSRLAKDNTNLDEIGRAIVIALTEDAINKEVGTGTTVTLSNDGVSDGTLASGSASLLAELNATLGGKYAPLTSNTYKTKTSFKWTIVMATDGTATITRTET